VIPDQPSGQAHTRLLVVLLVVFALLAGLYYTLRFGGWAMEGDASRMTWSADGIVKTGQLDIVKAYTNGFAYGAQLAFTSLVTGLSVQELQLSSSLWVFVVALVAFITYRELLGSASLAALGVLLLLVQPDFLFYVVRESHEKNTWVYALLLLFLLVRSYTYAQKPRKLVITIGLFYLVFWAMVSSNAFFAATFAGTLAIGFAGGWILNRLARHKQESTKIRGRALRRIIIITLACLTMVWIFINYAYQPALTFYYYFVSFYDRISMLLLGAQPMETPSSYNYVMQAWKSSGAYLALTGLQWLIALTSLVAWGIGLFHLSRLDQKRWLLWLMYTAFGVLLAYGVVTDFLGFLSSNLQLRMFTPFALFSSPLAAGLIYRGFQALRSGGRRLLMIPVIVVVVYAALAAALKVTTEPLFNNQWFFYSPAELSAARWTQAHEPEQQSPVWVDTWAHLAETFSFWEGYDPSRIYHYAYGLLPAPAPYTLISELVRLRANRAGNILPETGGQNWIYDNGLAQLYHLRARTPYQH
jgi:hypothetical protein